MLNSIIIVIILSTIFTPQSVVTCSSSITLNVLSTAQQQDDNISYDIYPFIRVYKNGTVERFFGKKYVPPSPHDPNHTGVQSKDITFSTTAFNNLKARLYLPDENTIKPGQKLPLLIYYHGGGFFAESAFSPTYHNHLMSLVSEARVVAVSVNYRLAPEYPLPTAYQDSWLALKWALSSHHDDQMLWLSRYADFDRVYLGGDSAGANIAHHMAIRVGSGDLGVRLRLQGMFLNCPFFLGSKAIGGENDPKNAYGSTLMKRLWLYAYPNRSAKLDDPLVNPAMDPSLKWVGCSRVLVYVAGNDVLRFRGWYYKSALEKSGWNGKVDLVEVKGQDHVFNLVRPKSVEAVTMLKRLGDFLNNHY